MLDGCSDDQVGAGQDRIIGKMMLRESAFPKSKPFCQHNLLEHFGIGLIVRHPTALTVEKKSEIHSRFLLVGNSVLVFMSRILV